MIMYTKMWMAAVGLTVLADSAGAQTDPQRRAAVAQELQQKLQDVQKTLQLKESRYQIGQIERVLEGAVEHGATVIRDRLQAMMPADMLLTENARARGFRLDGYGVFFDVQVPMLEGTLPWSFSTLDQNDLDIDNALKTLRSFVNASAGNDTNLQQALKRVELQVAPARPANVSAPSVIPGPANGGASRAATTNASSLPDDPILRNPNDAYRAAIRSALIDAMLEHSRGLGIGPNEWLTVAARSSEDRPRLAPADPEGQTVLISVRGSDLSAFLGGQIDKEEALKRIEVRVF